MYSCFEITTYITFPGNFEKFYDFSMKMRLFCNIYILVMLNLIIFPLRIIFLQKVRESTIFMKIDTKTS